MHTASEQHEHEHEAVRREVEIAAPPEEVWDALVTEEGRERWLEADPSREILTEPCGHPGRLVWWWWHEDEPPRRVELEVVAVPGGTRVTVVESAPHFPLRYLAASFATALV